MKNFILLSTGLLLISVCSAQKNFNTPNGGASGGANSNTEKLSQHKFL
ncbi:hypothetical protein AEQU2_00170 [Aequorivita lipolytica]|nr:hypothetical protein AEQU2_00170 [Aequorivita lipolytica]